MINPKYKYVGFGQFYSEAAMFPGTLAAELSFEENLDETVQEAKKDVMQKIEVANQYIKEYTLEGDDEIDTGVDSTYVARVKIERNKKTRKLWALVDSFTSSDSSIATVTNEGVVTGVKSGTVTITAKSGDRVIAMKDITVKGKDISNDKNDGNSSDNNGNGDVSNDKNDGNSSDNNGNGDVSNDKNNGNSSDNNGNGDVSDENNDKVTTVKKNYPKIGKKITVKGVKYKVTNASIKNKKYTVSCIGSASKKITKLSVPEYVSSSGFKFKVTGIENKAFYKYTKLKTVTIGKNVQKIGTQAFAKCSKLSKVTIKTTQLTKKNAGKKAFAGINKKAKFVYPKSKKSAYRKLFG